MIFFFLKLGIARQGKREIRGQQSVSTCCFWCLVNSNRYVRFAVEFEPDTQRRDPLELKRTD